VPAHVSPATISTLPAPVRDAYRAAVTDAMHPVFLLAAALAVIAFLLSLLLQEVPLRTSSRSEAGGTTGIAGTAADPSRVRAVERALSTIAGRENRWDVYRRVATRAGLPLEPPELWLLARLGDRARPPAQSRHPDVAVNVDGEHLAASLDALRGAGYVETEDSPTRLTPSGVAAYDQLVAARRAGLRDALDGLDPDAHPELRRILDEFARDLLVAAPARPAIDPASTGS
jgi:DNA-binding MarR family transcriptional regulator